jgi:hypothetical protein
MFFLALDSRWYSINLLVAIPASLISVLQLGGEQVSTALGIISLVCVLCVSLPFYTTLNLAVLLQLALRFEFWYLVAHLFLGLSATASLLSTDRACAVAAGSLVFFNLLMFDARPGLHQISHKTYMKRMRGFGAYLVAIALMIALFYTNEIPNMNVQDWTIWQTTFTNKQVLINSFATVLLFLTKNMLKVLMQGSGHALFLIQSPCVIKYHYSAASSESKLESTTDTLVPLPSSHRVVDSPAAAPSGDVGLVSPAASSAQGNSQGTEPTSPQA